MSSRLFVVRFVCFQSSSSRACFRSTGWTRLAGMGGWPSPFDAVRGGLECSEGTCLETTHGMRMTRPECEDCESRYGTNASSPVSSRSLDITLRDTEVRHDVEQVEPTRLIAQSHLADRHIYAMLILPIAHQEQEMSPPSETSGLINCSSPSLSAN